MGKEEIIIENNDFCRVDFNNPTTILSYGSKLLEDMGSFMKNVSIMTKTDETSDLKLDERLEKINNFINYLSSSDSDVVVNKKLLPVLSKKIGSTVNEIKNKIFGIDTYNESFADQYSKVNEEIDAIMQAVEYKKMSVIDSMEIDRAFINNMNGFITKLAKLIEVGMEDLENYKEETASLEQQDNLDDISKREIEVRNSLANLFEQKLESLKKSLVIAKNSILESKMKENVNMQLVIQYQEYNENTINILRNQSTSMITTKVQRNNLAEQQQLNQITNDIITKNSDTIVKNIEDVNSLREKGNIYVESLKKLSDNALKGIELIKKSDALVLESRRKNEPIIQQIMENLDNCRDEIASISSDSDIIKEKVFTKK